MKVANAYASWGVILGVLGRHLPDRPDGSCWLWRGALTPAGYGRVKVRGKAKMAHRAVYEAVHGPIGSPKILVLHSCDNPPCCNPAHLSLGDHHDNAMDMVARGRDQHAKRRAADPSLPQKSLCGCPFCCARSGRKFVPKDI